MRPRKPARSGTRATGKLSKPPPKGVFFKLDGTRVVPASDLADVEMTRLALTEITPSVYVSTMFLGIDMRHFRSGPPLVFETAVFVREGFEGRVGAVRRTSNWQSAMAHHDAAVSEVRARLR